MDLKPASTGEDSFKSPVVEVEAVEAVEANADLAVDAMFSDLATDSEDSDGWDNLSDCEDAIQFLRDDQIRDGLGKLYPPLPQIYPRSRRSRTWPNALSP